MRTTFIVLVSCLLGSGCSQSKQQPSNNEQVPAGDAVAPAASDSQMWVTAERIDRHTCPSQSCGVVGTLDFRSAATVNERKGNWVRITRVYDASCAAGRSEYVDKGNKACTPENGIVDGKFGEWIQAKFLSATRPSDPAETAAADEQLVKDSDDFTRYRRSFVTAARTLIDRGECTPADLQEYGGFLKSTSNAGAPVYFTYCGGDTLANRIYLNAQSGEIYR